VAAGNQLKPVAGPERLRVLQVLPSFRVGGAEQMASHLMLGLTATHDVAAVGLSSASNSVLEQRLRSAHVPLWHFGKRVGFDPRVYGLLEQVVREFRPHIIHTHLSVLRYVFPISLRRAETRIVHTLHSLAEYETDFAGRIVHWIAFRRAVLPVAISRAVAASVKRVYGLECPALVPNCIPVHSYARCQENRSRWRAQLGFSEDAIVFTSVSRLEPFKNPFLLLQAFAALPDARAHLALIGEGSLASRLDERIRELGLHGRVHLLGKRYDIPDCLAGSDIFVLASKYEGNPLAVMEAMAAGLPVIATAVGGVPELVESGQQGLIVPPEDLAALTQAMRNLQEDPWKRSRMAASAQERAEKEFGVTRMAQGYSSVYDEALAGRTIGSTPQ
jgi:glycosyltransferase involved in cell wall biosynthesis